MLSTNRPVRLRDESGAEYASRVEAADGTTLVLARPLDLPAASALGTGSRLEVCWTAESGVLRVPVQVVSTGAEGLVRLWHVETVGPVVREQRRSHVRVAVDRPGSLRRDDSARPCVIVDVSEAAVRCRLEKPAGATAAPEDPPGVEEEVEIAFALGEEEFSHAAAVYRVVDLDEGVELVLMLQIGEREATRLRRAVFAEQVRLRSLFGQ